MITVTHIRRVLLIKVVGLVTVLAPGLATAQQEPAAREARGHPRLAILP